MAVPNRGASAPDSTVRVHIILEIPVDTLLHPGPFLYAPDEFHLLDVQALVERRRRDALPEGDAELLGIVQDLLELTEGVQAGPLSRIIHGDIAWRVERPSPEGR